MSQSVEQKLAELGITLPTPTAPLANYVPSVRTGNLLFISGQVSIDGAGKLSTGKLGAGLDVDAGRAAARLCGINLIAQMKVALGDLDKVVRIVKLVGFVNSAPDFVDHPKVINGCSDLFVEVFGDKGRHARSAVGIAALPFDAAVEVEAIVEVA
ncbi:RidA family protein [Azorhizobium caulinodans]|uniref:Endoribonuclease L-PSP n=1 Tax=Azorhizobium caulinodans (strain ATCC 43989 / DSM 5975 / JCM 20966 / LMG 6465 / NBRC 14845 / NCIMB 13405 / ORS 571) TaxID=438753 RepID=A8I5T3_AZOC5|nr:RidA family protein [Azorhizobium caulinodans]BAF88316.1 endoribonuclease L-PSP [Azorhizobium caulinodans ORS 571]